MICDLYELKIMKDSTKNSSFVLMTELFCPAFNMAVNKDKVLVDDEILNGRYKNAKKVASINIDTKDLEIIKKAFMIKNHMTFL